MNRLVPARPVDNLIAATMFLYSMPRHWNAPAEALVAIPGQGEVERVIVPISIWNSWSTHRYLLIAGQNLEERTAEILDLERLQRPPYCLQRIQGVITAKEEKNTKSQANWVAETIREKMISSAALFVSPYHFLRVYLTVLKSLIDRDIYIPLLPVPLPMDMTMVSPESGHSMWQLVPGEARRILKYQKKGDCATFGELKIYQRLTATL